MNTLRVVRRCGIAVVVIASLVAGSQLVLAQADAVIGTWKLNVAKSKYDPGPAPQSGMLTIEVAGQGIKVAAKGVDAAGNPTVVAYTANYDGKAYPITGPTDYDSISLKRIDAFRADGTRTKAGKPVQTYTRVVSKDGKVLTITTKGTNAKDQKDRKSVV